MHANQNMTEGKIFSPILSFMIPLMIGQFFQQFYSMTDSVIIGNFVEGNGLAAISASNQVVNLLIGFFIGLTSGMGVMIAQAHGADDQKRLRVASNTSLFICLIGGLLVTIVGFLLSTPLLTWMNTPEGVMKDAVLYLQLYFAGSIFNIIYNMGASVLRAVGNSRSPLFVLLISSAVNVILDLIFVLAFDWGIGGVGVATLIAQIVSAVCVVWMLMRTKESYGIKIRMIRYDKEVFSDIVKIGVPSGLQHTIITISNMIVQTNINGFGEAAMSAYSLYWRLDNFLMIPVNCLVMSATTFSGQNAGAGKTERIKKGMRVMLIMGNIYSLLTAVVLFFAAGFFLRIFTPDEGILYYGVLQARLVTVGYCFITTFQIILGFVRGMGRSFAPMLISIANMCFLRVIYLFTIVKAFPTMEMVNLSYPITWGTTLICTIVYYYLVKQKMYHRFERTEMIHYVKQQDKVTSQSGTTNPTILITGFEPFAGEAFNPSEAVLALLPETIVGMNVVTKKLPTEFSMCFARMQECIKEYRPSLVLCLGQAGGRAFISPERIAINLADADIPDNSGKKPTGEVLVPRGAAAYFSNLPFSEIVSRLEEESIPVKLSNHAGTYVCNDLFYRLLHFMKKEGYPKLGGFIHLPYAKEQVAHKKEGTPFLELEEMAKAICLITEISCTKSEMR